MEFFLDHDFKRREKQFARPAKEPRAQNAVGTLHVELCMWLPSFRLCGRGMGQADRWRRPEHASGVAREGAGPSKRSAEQSHLPERPLRNRGGGPQESAREANLTATLMQGEGTLGSVTRRTEPSAKSCESGLSRLGRYSSSSTPRMYRVGSSCSAPASHRSDGVLRRRRGSAASCSSSWVRVAEPAISTCERQPRCTRDIPES